MRSRSHTPLLIALLALAFTVTAPAGARAEDKTKHLETMFSNFLALQTQRLATAQTPATLIQDGPIDIEKTGEYYAITLPQLSVRYSDGQTLRIGMISINANAAENPGEWTMTLAIPTPILGYDASGSESLRIEIGTQKSAGIWNEDFKSFTKLDAAYKNVELTTPAGGHVHVPDILVRYDLDMVSQGLWSGPLFVRAFKPTWDIPLIRAKGSLDKISALITLDQFSQSLFQKIISQPLMTVSLYDPQILNAAKAVKTELSLEKLSAQSQATGQSLQTITLGSASAKIGFDKDETGANMNAQILTKFKDLKIVGAPAEFSDLIPEHGTLNINQKNIPEQNLSKAFGNGGLNAAMALLKIPVLLAQAQSTLESEASYIANSTYNINLSGIVLADIAAMANATAQGRLRFEGLDKVLSIAQVNGSSTRASPHGAFFRGLASTLERMKTFAKIETTPSQNFVHLYDFKLDQSGAFTINDKAASAVFFAPIPAAAP